MRLEQMVGHRDFTQFDLIWDLTNNVDYTFWKDGSYYSKFPCLLRGHLLWHVGKARGSLNVPKALSQD